MHKTFLCIVRHSLKKADIYDNIQSMLLLRNYHQPLKEEEKSNQIVTSLSLPVCLSFFIKAGVYSI